LLNPINRVSHVSKPVLKCFNGTLSTPPSQAPPLSSGSQLGSVQEAEAKVEERRVIVSGIQPTGIPHIGNYLGALQQWAHLQNTSPPGTKLLFSVVDLHAYTLRQDPVVLKRWKQEAMGLHFFLSFFPPFIYICIYIFPKARDGMRMEWR
jgi:tryptophanyl-tRNA synthetase